jgi:hypothetical protein
VIFPATDVDKEIRSQIIRTCRSVSLRREFLRTKNLTLEKCLESGRLEESVEFQARKIEGHAFDKNTDAIFKKKLVLSVGKDGHMMEIVQRRIKSAKDAKD